MRGNAAFDRLASLLMSRDQTWLAHELYADLESERGALHVEEYVFREAGTTILRKANVACLCHLMFLLSPVEWPCPMSL